ncbi:MAG: hypothetical protein NC250_09325 [Alistipes senegalensis]|nr:hypothetical protein [Bacteroides cellulosilyticus]MCM1352915.1 hypothetical protein [Alistipes senegalensis]
MTAKEIEIGKWYHLSGDIENGYMDGKPYISHEEVTRVVKRVTDTHIVCECGRRFIINENLKVNLMAFRQQPATKP